MARTGLLIIRAWIEDASTKALRADVRATTDVSTGFDTSTSFAEAADVGRAVDAWLADMVAIGPHQWG
jgi:hypothetical protein